MIKKILISLFTVTLLTSCGGSGEYSYTSSGGGTETASESNPSNPSQASQASNCAVGRYAFSTVRDGKVHFDGSFAPAV